MSVLPRSTCAVPSAAAFCSSLIYRLRSALLSYWVTLKWFQLPQLLLVLLSFVTLHVR